MAHVRKDTLAKTVEWAKHLFSWCLCLLFVVGKLCGVVGWGWLWVLSPLWVPVVLGLVVLLCYAILMIKGACIGLDV